MRPTPVALGLVRLSTRLLPAGDTRQRYRWELYADLTALDRSHQLTYASGVFSTAWQLRRELTQETDPMNDTTTIRPPLLCRLNLPPPLGIRDEPGGQPPLPGLHPVWQGRPTPRL